MDDRNGPILRAKSDGSVHNILAYPVLFFVFLFKSNPIIPMMQTFIQKKTLSPLIMSFLCGRRFLVTMDAYRKLMLKSVANLMMSKRKKMGSLYLKSKNISLKITNRALNKLIQIMITRWSEICFLRPQMYADMR